MHDKYINHMASNSSKSISATSSSSEWALVSTEEICYRDDGDDIIFIELKNVKKVWIYSVAVGNGNF